MAVRWEYTFFVPQQYGEAYQVRRWPSFSALLDGYYAEKDRAERLRTKSKELHKAVHNMYDRALRKQAARRDELAASGKSEKLRLYGELLSANLYMAQKGMSSITVPNWYDEGNEVTIPLDLRYTPSQNAQNYFKNYKKKQTAARMLVDLLAEGEKEITYLETVLYEVESASGEAALGEIRAELKSQGYLKYYKQRDKRQKPADFLRFTSSDGFEILVGRNNAQNEPPYPAHRPGQRPLFHVQKAPGSHVVVMSRGEDIPDTTRQEAAELAVIHSSAFRAGAAAKVAVDTTEVKNIWKANGAKPVWCCTRCIPLSMSPPGKGWKRPCKKSKALFLGSDGVFASAGPFFQKNFVRRQTLAPCRSSYRQKDGKARERREAHPCGRCCTRSSGTSWNTSASGCAGTRDGPRI